MSEPLGFEVFIDGPQDKAIERVTATLKTEGFGVLTRVDIDQAFKDADEKFVQGTAVSLPVDRRAVVGGGHVQRLLIKQSGGLTGTPITINGLSGTFAEVLLRLQRLDGTEIAHRLKPSRPTYVVEASPGDWQVGKTYLCPRDRAHFAGDRPSVICVGVVADCFGLAETGGYDNGVYACPQYHVGAGNTGGRACFRE